MKAPLLPLAAAISFGQNGIYTVRVPVPIVTRVADRNSPIPGGIGNFTAFFDPSISGGMVAFVGLGASGQEGLYLSNGQSLLPVADRNTPIPGGVGNFTFFRRATAPALDGENVAFVGSGSGGQLGIYTTLGGTLSKVIDLNDQLDGRRIIGLSLDPEALSGDQIAFTATFPGFSQEIYVAQLTPVPEPSTLGLAAVGAIGLVACARRRRRPGRRA